MRRKIVVVLLFVSTVVVAQKTNMHQTLYWVRYYNQLAINKQFTWHNEIDNRRFFEGNKQHQLFFHTHLHYKFYANADAAVGFTHNRQWSQDPQVASPLVIPEYRPFQEINYTNAVSKQLQITQRFRVDERFVHKFIGDKLVNGFDYSTRLRYRLQAVYTVNKLPSKHPVTLKISDEVMINAGKTIVYNQFDQNRLSANVEVGLGKTLSAELGYIRFHQQRKSGHEFFNRDIFRFTLYHKLSPTKKHKT